MMRIVIALFLLAAATTRADAKVYKLADFSIEDVKARCTKVHGEFFTHTDGTYGCSYAKGTVSCDTEQHCSGELKEPAKRRQVSHPPVYHHRHYQQYREYRWYQW